ncbi:MAG: alpha/beta hydrolase [Methylocella sp.]
MRRFTFWPWRTGFRGLLAARVRGSRLSPHHLLVIVITVCGLAGCASPTGFLAPVAARAPGASEVEMLVATTRMRTTPAEMFSGERAQTLDFADIVVSIPPVHQPGKVEDPHQIPGNPATDFVTLKADYNDRTEALATFRRLVRTTPKKQVLVFVHGFNNHFEDAVFRFAQIVHDSGAEVVPVLFTWPSKGSVFAYGYDHESAEYSRDALEDGLRFLAKDPEVGEITVYAHSMGNWVTLEALRQMAIRDGKVAEKIRDVILASPDVDVNVAEKQITAMGPRAGRPRFFLFASEDDRALAASRALHSDQRLGSIDPDQEPWKGTLRSEGIRSFNLTSAGAGDITRHDKPFEIPQVVALVGQIIMSGQTQTDSRVSPGESITRATAGAAAAVGHAAGLVVSAPVAIVDPLTREQYGDQIDAFSRSVQDVVTPQ